jgi:hypothetical protein
LFGTAAAAAGLIYSKKSEPSPLKSDAILIAAPQEDGEIKIGDKAYQVPSSRHSIGSHFWACAQRLPHVESSTHHRFTPAHAQAASLLERIILVPIYSAGFVLTRVAVIGAVLGGIYAFTGNIIIVGTLGAASALAVFISEVWPDTRHDSHSDWRFYDTLTSDSLTDATEPPTVWTGDDTVWANTGHWSKPGQDLVKN